MQASLLPSAPCVHDRDWRGLGRVRSCRRASPLAFRAPAHYASSAATSLCHDTRVKRGARRRQVRGGPRRRGFLPVSFPKDSPRTVQRVLPRVLGPRQKDKVRIAEVGAQSGRVRFAVSLTVTFKAAEGHRGPVSSCPRTPYGNRGAEGRVEEGQDCRLPDSSLSSEPEGTLGLDLLDEVPGAVLADPMASLAHGLHQTTNGRVRIVEPTGC